MTVHHVKSTAVEFSSAPLNLFQILVKCLLITGFRDSTNREEGVEDFH